MPNKHEADGFRVGIPYVVKALKTLPCCQLEEAGGGARAAGTSLLVLARKRATSARFLSKLLRSPTVLFEPDPVAGTLDAAYSTKAPS